MPRTTYPPDFEAFWAAYPRHKSKKYAFQVWCKLAPSQIEQAYWIQQIDKQKMSEDWAEKKYIPYPGTWLNGEMWDDELTPVVTEADKIAREVAEFEETKTRRAGG